jgi:hypothetical protein
MRKREEGHVSIFRTRLAAISLALMIGGIVTSPVYAQNLDAKNPDAKTLDAKTGTGPRGTPAAPSTDPAQAQSSTRPPVGMAKSGTPVAGSKENSREAMSGKPDQISGKSKEP